MADRPIWRGHLRLALVSCPVALVNAHHDRADLHFHLINPDTGHRVRMVTLDAETDQPVGRGDLVKGYEFKKDHFLLLTSEDFEAARVASSSTMTIDKFIKADSIAPIYFDSSYYVVPDGDSGADVYAVLQEAIAASGMVALTHVVIARRERAVAILPMRNGLVAHTLYDERDLQDPKRVFDALKPHRTDRDMVKLASQLIERQIGQFDPADAQDRYEARLRAVIDAKLKGEGISPEEEEAPGQSNVVDLMAALRQSLGQGGASAAAVRKPAKGGKAPAAAPAERKRAPSGRAKA